MCTSIKFTNIWISKPQIHSALMINIGIGLWTNAIVRRHTIKPVHSIGNSNRNHNGEYWWNPISISLHNIFIQIPSIFSIVIPIGALNGVHGFDCMQSDDGVWSESKTDIDHECGMYLWYVDSYIGKFDRCSHLTSDTTIRIRTDTHISMEFILESPYSSQLP